MDKKRYTVVLISVDEHGNTVGKKYHNVTENDYKFLCKKHGADCVNVYDPKLPKGSNFVTKYHPPCRK